MKLSKRQISGLVENLIIRDDIEPNGLDVLEYAGFSGDGGLLYEAAAQAALLAGDGAGNVVVKLPSIGSFLRDYSARFQVEFFMRFNAIRRGFTSALEAAQEQIDERNEPIKKGLFDDLMQATVILGQLFERAVEDPDVPSHELLQAFDGAARIRDNIASYEGASAVNAEVLKKMKSLRFDNSAVLAMRGGFGSPYGITQDLFDFEGAFEDIVRSSAQEALTVLFKALEIRARPQVEISGGRGVIAIRGPLGRATLDNVHPYEDTEYLFRRPSTSPRRLSKAPRMSKMKPRRMPSNDYTVVFASQHRAKVRDSLKRAEKKAQKRAGIKELGSLKASDFMTLVKQLDAARKRRGL